MFCPSFGGGFRPKFRQATHAERAELVAELDRRGFAVLLGRIERSITTPSVWGARPEAAAEDVLLTWKQLVALHRQSHSLPRELEQAEIGARSRQQRGEQHAASRRQGAAVVARRHRGPDRGFRRLLGPQDPVDVDLDLPLQRGIAYGNRKANKTESEQIAEKRAILGSSCTCDSPALPGGLRRCTGEGNMRPSSRLWLVGA